jgi:acyl carrier protein
MDQQQFVSLVEEILEVEPGSLGLDDSLEELDWDSLANISLIAEIDSRIGKSLDAERLAACGTVQDLYALLGEDPSGN